LSVDWIPSDSRILALEDGIEDTMAIHEVATRGGGSVVVFTGQFLRSPEMIYDHVLPSFRALGFVPLLRQENGHDTLIAYPAPAVAGRRGPWVNVMLFAVTVLTTLTAGTLQSLTAEQVNQLAAPLDLVRVVAAHWVDGLPFAVPLLAILGVHEFGHYFLARAYKLDVSLPYFIPFIPLPPVGTGTLGAVIRIQSPFESRKALFDVGIAGPLAGLVVAVPVVALGLMQAQVVRVTDFGGTINEPLLFQWMALLFGPARGQGTDILMNPLLMAGWWGFLITALNLTPVSQLDGGHIVYGLFGPAHRYIARAMFAIAAVVTLFVNPSYLLMLILVFAMGIEHPPALNDLTPIGTPRRLLGLATLLLFFILITPNPFPN